MLRKKGIETCTKQNSACSAHLFCDLLQRSISFDAVNYWKVLGRDIQKVLAENNNFLKKKKNNKALLCMCLPKQEGTAVCSALGLLS